jgi:hypothetical protein
MSDLDTDGTHVGAHLTFTDCQYTVDTTLDGTPMPPFPDTSRRN